MKCNFSIRQILLLFTLLVVVSVTKLMAGVVVSAQFEPSTLAVGESGRYVITAQGDSKQVSGQFSIPSGSPQLTFPDSISVLGQSTSQQFAMNNTGVSMTKSVIVNIRPRKVGKFKVAKFRIQLGDTVYDVPGTELEVVAQGSQVQQSGGSIASSTSLKLMFARNKIYVGEAMRSQLQLLLPSNVRIFHNRNNPLPKVTGDAFTLSPFVMDNVTEEKVTVEGKNLQKFSFPTVVTPLKSGQQTLRFDYPITVARTDRSVMRPDPFDQMRMDSLFNQMMGMNGEPEQIELSTGQLSVDVLPLPDKGKPSSFNGAIGNFEASLDMPVARGLRVGEPLTLKLTLSGEGNFSRIEAPSLQGTDQWRVYEPRSEFRQEDTYGVKGTKTFEYVVIPQQSGALSTPPILFSFFNPETEEYKTIELPPFKIEVVPSPVIKDSQPLTSKPPATQSVQETVKKDTEKKNNSANTGDLVGIRESIGATVSSLSPVFTQAYFGWFNGVALLALVIGYPFLLRWHRLRSDPLFALKTRLRKECVQHLKATAKEVTHDPIVFFTRAESALRVAVAYCLEREGESMTRTDVEEHLQSLDLSAKCSESMNTILSAVEGMKYAGRKYTVENREELFAELEKLIKKLLS